MKVPHPSSPTIVGEIAVRDGALYGLHSGQETFLSGNSPTYSEADAGYLSADNIPLTRVGDNTYLPVDIKGDFKGAIQPYSEHPYFLVENDQTIVALRPGFNGEFQRVFYAYSYNDITVNDLRLTDSEYRPNWLRADEYVMSIVDGNSKGFLAQIASTTDLSILRMYWVDHNGTLESKFHTFLDVTATMQSVPAGMRSIIDNGSATLIPELNLFVTLSQTATNKLMISWYSVDRAFQTVRSDTIAPILPTKIVDWTDMSGVFAGTSNQQVVMDGTTEANLANYYKFINEPATRITTRLLDGLQTSNRVRLTYAYDAGVVRLFIPLLAYLAFTGTDYRWGWTIHLDYTVATNKVRYNPVTDQPLLFQTLPFVVDVSKSTISSATVVPVPMTDDFKANKFPLSVGTAPYNISSASFRTEVVGDQVVTSQVWSANTSVFSVMNTPFSSVYVGATTAAKKMDLYRRPYFNNQKAAYKSFAAYDASILSKQLTGFSFVSNTALTGKSQSRLYGEAAITTKILVATLPNLTVGTAYSVDSNTFKPSLTSPSSVVTAAGYNTRYAPWTFIDGNNPMIMSQVSYNMINSASGTWLAYNVDPIAGTAQSTFSIVPGTMTTMMNAVTALTIAQSTYVPTGGVTTSSHALYPIYLDVAGGYFYALYTLVFGNEAEAFQYEYAVLKLPLNGNVINWPATAAEAVISRQAGGKKTGNLRLTGYVADRESFGVYRHTDGTFYMLANTAVYHTTVGGSTNEIRAFRLTNQMLFNGTTLIGAHSISAAGAAGIHPDYGLYYSSAANDFRAKANIYYKDKTSVTPQATRLYQSCDAWIAGGVTSSTLFVISSKSAAGFVLYSSEIQVFMYGKSSIVPTQTIVLSDVTPNPANKTFNFYVQWNGIGFVLTPSLSSIPESPTSTYVGSVVTNATGIVTNTIRKVTRIDNYRLFDTAPIIGSAIRAYQKQPAIQAYVFDTTAEVDQYRATHVPPAPSAVFNSWDRTNGAEYFPGGVGATGDAAAWSFQTNPDRIVQPNNTAAYASFISPTSYTDYEFETTLYSPSGDDDVIGMTAAFFRTEAGANLQLFVLRTGGGISQTGGNASAQTFNFGFAVYGATLATADRPKLQSKLVGANRSNSATPAGPGWAGMHTRIRVVRRGNVFTAYASDWSTDRTNVPFLESSEITVDITDIAALAPLKDTAKYGYTTNSQPGSTYYDTTFSGGLDTGRVIDLQTGTVWKYSFANSEWTPVATTPRDELGYVRYVTNPDTGKTYFVTQDGVFKQ